MWQVQTAWLWIPGIWHPIANRIGEVPVSLLPEREFTNLDKFAIWYPGAIRALCKRSPTKAASSWTALMP
jgi:hypothetical protein